MSARRLIPITISMLIAGCTFSSEQLSQVSDTAETAPANLQRAPPSKAIAVFMGNVAGDQDSNDSTHWVSSTPGGSMNLTGGGNHVKRDVTLTLGKPCSKLVDLLVFVDLAHPNPSKVKMTLSTLVNGQVAATTTIWDGGAPNTDNGKFGSTMKVARLIGSNCAAYRLDVLDFGSPGISTGKVNSWEVRGRQAVLPPVLASTLQPTFFGTITPSLNPFYGEFSRQKFQFTNGGMYTAQFPYSGDDTLPQIAVKILDTLDAQNFPYASFDKNGDHILGWDELTIAWMENLTRGGSHRWISTVSKKTGYRVDSFVLAGQTTNFTTIAHELMHSMGSPDLYTGDCYSQNMSLMSCTIGQGNQTYYPDPWERIQYGWLPAPRTLDLSVPGSRVELGNESFVDSSGARSQPAKIQNPNNPKEYVLLEYRDGGGYDKDVGGRGVLAWYILENATGDVNFDTDRALHPDGVKAHSHAWTVGEAPYRILWSDGRPALNWFQVISSGHSGSVIVEVVNDKCAHAAWFFGIEPNHSFGIAPPSVQTWWTNTPCTPSLGPDFPTSTCQLFSDLYGIVPTLTFGAAPADVQQWWTAHNCSVPAQGDCQALSNSWGIVANSSFGVAPQFIRDYWSNPANNCSATPNKSTDLCETAANTFGICAGHTFGTAPADVQQWWTEHGCNVCPFR